jgi:1-acyl-sn-glycerol-3-phosphate acyltransferase
LLRVICGTHIEVRGAENIPSGPVLVAGKHQSSGRPFAILSYPRRPLHGLEAGIVDPVIWLVHFQVPHDQTLRGAASPLCVTNDQRR